MYTGSRWTQFRHADSGCGGVPPSVQLSLLVERHQTSQATYGLGRLRGNAVSAAAAV